MTTATRCPTCHAEVLVDWNRSRLDELPQRLAVFCPKCGYRHQRVAPTSDGGDGQFWRVSKVRCRLCGAEAHSVFPSGADDDNLQCGSCDHMTCEAIASDDDCGG